MPAPTRQSRARRPSSTRIGVEALETRYLPSAAAWPGLVNPVAETEPNNTVLQAIDLGDVNASVAAVGTIGADAGPADVDLYSFSLAQPAAVTLNALAQPGSSFAPVVSLYNNDPYDFGDTQNPYGYRLLGQEVGAAGATAQLTQTLTEGSYFVAVSGAGNLYFSPLIADSGYDGSTGAYGLEIDAAPLPSAPEPVIISADPAVGASLSMSPLVLRFEYSAPLNPWSVAPEQTVTLTYNPTGTFGDGNDVDVPLASTNVSTAGTELQVFPAAPLQPGSYRLFIAGDPSTGNPTVTDASGNPLGSDFTDDFTITGIEGHVAGDAPNDTAAGAGELPDLSHGIVHVAGVIGDDPTMPNPGSDVDMYHFSVTGAGTYQFMAEVFAGRIGSPLDAGVSLFQRDPATGQLDFIAGNDNTQNPTPTADGVYQPLFTDPALFAGLTAGDYYVAVSGSGNVPDANLQQLPGSNGVFDPNVSGSGTGGFTTGPYVLNVLLQPDTGAPHVVSTSVAPGATLDGPPTVVDVKFDQPVDLQQLAYTTFLQTNTGRIDAVYVRGADGQNYYPRLASYDPNTGQASFLFYDAVPTGPAELHLSGALGLTGLGGSPLVGNDASGDYVVPFTVGGQPRGNAGAPLLWQAQGSNHSLSQAQDLGPLFPRELAATGAGGNGVAVVQTASATAPTDPADFYRFDVLQDNQFFISVNGSGLPDGTLPVLLDVTGALVPVLPQGNSAILAGLQPGTYFIMITCWTPGQPGGVGYQLRISTVDAIENPTPLTAGPAPALRLRLVSDAPSPAAPIPAPAAAAAPSVLAVAPPPVSAVVAEPQVSTTLLASVEQTVTVPALEGITAPIVQVVAPAVAVSGVPATGLDIPAGVLASLSSGPVGGVRSNSDDLATALYLRMPGQTSLAGSFAQTGPLAYLLFVLQGAGDPGLVPVHEEPADGTPVQESRSAPALSPAGAESAGWAPMFDLLFRMSDWLLDLPAQLAAPARAEPAMPAPREATQNRPGPRRTTTLGLAAAGGLVSLAALAPMRQKTQRLPTLRRPPTEARS